MHPRSDGGSFLGDRKSQIGLIKGKRSLFFCGGQQQYQDTHEHCVCLPFYRKLIMIMQMALPDRLFDGFSHPCAHPLIIE